MSEISESQYQHYEFVVSGNSIKKHILNEGAPLKESVIRKIVLTNAGDLGSQIDFACYQDKSSAFTVLTGAWS